MRKSPIISALFPDVRGRILAATLANPEKSWYLSELADTLRTRPSSLQREVNALSKAGILEQRRDGKRLYLKPDVQSPVFADLSSLFQKTTGLIPILQHEMEPLSAKVRLSFVYGSMARSQENSASDVDLLIVGSTGLALLVPVLRKAEKMLRRPVNVSIYTDEEFLQKARTRDHFLSTVLNSPRQFIKGSEHELEAFAGWG